MTTTTKKAIVWTKTNSPDSRKAVAHLKRMGYTVEERNIVYDNPWNMAKLKEAIPGVKGVPQIVIDGVLLGGIKELMAHPDAKIASRAALPTKESVATAKVARTAVHTAAKATHAANRQTRIDAKKTPMQGTTAPTRAERHALIDTALAARKLQRQSMQPIPAIAPEGYQLGTPATATPEQVAARHAEHVAERAAKAAAAKAAAAPARAAKAAANKARVQTATQASAEHRAAKAAEYKARVEAVKQAQRAALVHKG